MDRTSKLILEELKEHLPFTILASCLAIITVGLFTMLTDSSSLPALGGNLFHVFHPLHILASAATTTSMYWKYRKNVILSALIGGVGAVAICTLSDIIMPFLGGRLLSIDMRLHVCSIEHPVVVAPFLAVGVAMGFLSPRIVEKSTLYSHSAHILLSTMASLVYLISFGMVDWFQHIGYIFVVLTVAVLLPCCLSDIVFPLFFVERGRPPESPSKTR